jgi:gliding motility-associated lipoprotein GldH
MIKRINNGLIMILLSLIVISSACNSPVVFTDSAVMPDNTWRLSFVPDFTAQITDTINASDVFFTIRTGSDYPFRNIWLFVTVTSPDGKRITDTLDYDLADDKGDWYGKGFGDIHELILPYKKNVFFPMKGSYQFKIQHGMRIGDLNGVYDFGLKIEKYRSNQ